LLVHIDWNVFVAFLLLTCLLCFQFLSKDSIPEVPAEGDDEKPKVQAKDVSAAGRYFQLEELEDRDSSTTELYLHVNQTVSTGATDGPSPIATSGTWKQDPDGQFTLVLSRTFETGKEKAQPTDVGEFNFTVNRSYVGEMTFVGANVAVTGIMHNVDETFGDQEIGYFNMIDTTEERQASEDDNDENSNNSNREPRLKPKPLSIS
jgi:hypothetical protein